MTEKLFWLDPYQREFTATLLEQSPVSDGHAVLLDRTCFYATSGGQPNDLGTLNSIAVTDVVYDGDRLLHFVHTPIKEKAVHGVLDWKRRFDHMQHHTGQHVLSAAFFRLFQAETSSFHLGELYCSIELNKPDLKEQQIREAEDLANSIVFSGTPVSAFQVDPEHAKQYPLRKQSDLKEALRIIQIGDFDLSPCSGTHVKNAGEVGMIFVHGFEKLSQTLKVTFLCGERVRLHYRKDLAILKKLSKSLTTSFELLPDSIAKLQSQTKELRKEVAQLKEERLKTEALELLAQAKNPIILVWGRPYQEVRFLAQRLSEHASTLGVLASSSDNRVVFFKNPALEFDLNRVFQELRSKTSAKGGGPAHFLEAGGIPATEDLERLLRELSW